MAERTHSSDPSSFNIDLLLKQARTYLAFGEQLQPLSERFHEALEQEGDWGEAVRRYFNEIKTALTQATDDPESHSELAHLWAATLEIWQQAVASVDFSTSLAALKGQNTEAWQIHQQAQIQYLGLLRQAAKEALDLMEQRLDERTARGTATTRLRDLYNLWVECNEETYGRLLRSPEYGEISGRLLNTLLHCYTVGEVKP